MHPRLRTQLCEQLGLRVPIVQAPMAGGWTTPDLVLAVAACGGLGSVPAARTTVEELRAFIETVRAGTNRPFAVNFLLAPPEPPPSDVHAVQDVLDELRAEVGLPPGPRDLRLPPVPMDEQVELALSAGVRVISFAMGPPGSLVDRIHGAGAQVIVMVTSVDEAIEAEAGGADVIVAQGIEAGGHRSTFRVGSDEELPRIGTLSLVPQVVDAVSVPVVAAGGIRDGRGVAAAISLGAQGVQLGTRFLFAPESGAGTVHREWLEQGTETSTTVTRFFTGRPARGFRNRFVQALEASGVEPLPWPYQALAAEDLFRHAKEHGLPDMMVLYAGQGLRIEHPRMGTAAVVKELVSEASEALVQPTASGATREE